VPGRRLHRRVRARQGTGGPGSVPGRSTRGPGIDLPTFRFQKGGVRHGRGRWGTGVGEF
jgi:hypothetical protein